MNHISSAFALPFSLLAASVALAGCAAGPNMTVRVQAAQNPLAPTTTFTVERASLDPSFQVVAQSESAWLADKSAETRASWNGDKSLMSEKFVESFMHEKGALAAQPSPGHAAFTVRARYLDYTPKQWGFMQQRNGALSAEVEIVDAAGHTVDAIRFYANECGGYTATQSAEECAEKIGGAAAKYVKKRAGL